MFTKPCNCIANYHHGYKNTSAVFTLNAAEVFLRNTITVAVLTIIIALSIKLLVPF